MACCRLVACCEHDHSFFEVHPSDFTWPQENYGHGDYWHSSRVVFIEWCYTSAEGPHRISLHGCAFNGIHQSSSLSLQLACSMFFIQLAFTVVGKCHWVRRKSEDVYHRYSNDSEDSPDSRRDTLPSCSRRRCMWKLLWPLHRVDTREDNCCECGAPRLCKRCIVHVPDLGDVCYMCFEDYLNRCVDYKFFHRYLDHANGINDLHLRRLAITNPAVAKWRRKQISLLYETFQERKLSHPSYKLPTTCNSEPAKEGE